MKVLKNKKLSDRLNYDDKIEPKNDYQNQEKLYNLSKNNNYKELENKVFIFYHKETFIFFRDNIHY